MNIQQAIQATIDKQDLSHQQMSEVMRGIMNGECNDAQIAGFLTGLRSKGETVTEIAAAAYIMRQMATPVPVTHDKLIDTCGTGGDSLGTFNISTTAALVVAAAGGRVAKHGNRSVSGKSGSADVLEAAGVKLEITPPQVAQCIEEIGVGFMFAPMHHKAMKHAVNARRQLGVRTLFNILGPLTNPAAARHQLLGVFSNHWLQPLAEVLKDLGSKNSLIVHADDGMDEISIAGPTQIAELKESAIDVYTITPQQFGLPTAELKTITADSVENSLDIMHRVLDNQAGPCRDIVLLNAAAGIYVAGMADSIKAAVDIAYKAIENGEAKSRLAALIKLTNSF